MLGVNSRPQCYKQQKVLKTAKTNQKAKREKIINRLKNNQNNMALPVFI